MQRGYVLYFPSYVNKIILLPVVLPDKDADEPKKPDAEKAVVIDLTLSDSEDDEMFAPKITVSKPDSSNQISRPPSGLLLKLYVVIQITQLLNLVYFLCFYINCSIISSCCAKLP